MSLWGAPLWELAAAAMVGAGALFCLVAGIGIVRLGDVFMRMHATTKAGTLGAGLVMGAVALASGEAGAAARAGGALVFLLLTAPVAAHMIARAAYRAGARLSPRTWIDERSGAEPGDQRSGAGTGAPEALASGETPPAPPAARGVDGASER